MFTLGIDIGGTKCAVVLGRDKMCENVKDTVIDKRVFATAVKRGWKAIVDDLIFTAEDILTDNGVGDFKEIKAIGISCGGPLDSQKGLIQCPPNLPDWDNVPITEIFTEHFGCPVVLQNDANASALAEWKFGAGKGTRNMIFLTFGTGMGAGLILNGQLYTGACDLAGEVGHIRLTEKGPLGYGKEGSFEGYCSGGGIVNLAKLYMKRHYQQRAFTKLYDEENGTDLTAKSISLAAKAGDETGKEIYAESAEKLGMMVAMMVDFLNPEKIVIGSIYSRDTNFFESTVKKTIQKECLPLAAEHCEVVPAALTESIGDIAALGLVL